jgi:resuscitation-promoting factor RpfB
MASESAAAQDSNSGTSSSSTSTGGSTVSAPPPDPGTAQSIAYNMLPSFGFNQSSQYTCLVSLWNQESGWVYDAENASGAYGIPQALPASKMATAGSDYLTDPTTQIKWGLGYISQVYGTPCGAWDHEEADGWY